MILRAVCIFLFFPLSFFRSAAQTPAVIFDHYGPAEGFTTRTCRTVVKTRDGFIWITTNDGLVRFDSEKFLFYRHHPADPESIQSNLTDQLVRDDKDLLWVVSGDGIDCFNPSTEIFTHCYLEEGKIKIHDFKPEALYYDSLRKKIWISTWRGLYTGRSGEARLEKVKIPAGSDEKPPVFIDIKMDASGLLWLCNGKGFYSYDPSSTQFNMYRVPAYESKAGADNGVMCIYPDGDHLWLGTWQKGLVYYHVKTGQGEHFYYTDKTKNQNGITHITRTGLPEEEDLLWMSTPNFGLATFNRKTRQFHFYAAPDEKDKSGIRGLTNRLFADAKDGMWIAAESGLHRYDYSQQLFKTTDLVSQNPLLRNAFALESFCVQANAEGNDSIAWFNVPYVGLYRYVFASGKLLPAPAALHISRNSALYAVYISPSGELWMGTSEQGLTGFNLKTESLLLPQKKFFTREKTFATSFFEDAAKHLWIGTAEGLYILDRDKMEPVAVDVVNQKLKALKSGALIQAIAADKNGNTWFVAGSGKAEVIGRYQLSTQQLDLFSMGAGSLQEWPEGLQIRALTVAGQDIYFATAAGLLKATAVNKEIKFSLFTVKDGLINDAIFQVISDPQGRIWCSTEFGISCYQPQSRFFINYDYTGSGLGPLKSPGLGMGASGSVIYVCQQGGFNSFHPSQIQVQPAAPLRFTGMELFNQPYRYQNRIPADGDQLQFRYHENMIAVSFAMLSFSNAANNQYAFRLDGLETEWTYTKENRASYAHLSPGKYTLLVKAANSSGVWTEKPIALIIIIRPPFWKTGWFIAVVVLLVAALLYLLYRYRIRQLLRLQMMRNTISRNLHDEIGSTLTSITILSKVSQQAMDQDPVQAKEMLDKIAQQSRTIQQSMSDIVWTIRSDHDRIESLLVRLREYAADTLEPLNITTSIEMEESLMEQSLGMEARKEVLLICKEALNNIARHAGATAVVIQLLKEKRSLVMRISDNGSWKEKKGSSGTGLMSMKQRAASIGGEWELQTTPAGTTICLRLPVT